MATKRELEADVAGRLAWLNEHGFRYYKSAAQFRAQGEGLIQYLTPKVTVRSGDDSSFALYIAVRLDAVEQLIRDVKREEPKLGHYDRTIWFYSPNIGPGKHRWNWPTHGEWHFVHSRGIGEQIESINRLVVDLALPYLELHSDPEEVRETLLREPVLANNMRPWEQVLAIDLINAPERVPEDVDRLRVLNKSRDLDQMEQFVARVMKRLEGGALAAG